MIVECQQKVNHILYNFKITNEVEMKRMIKNE